MEERIETTFWMDFTIADTFGENAIKDTFYRAFEEWKSNYKYLTELVMVLNHKAWQWSERNNSYTRLYTELYEQASYYACENLKGDELKFYFNVTD